MSTPIERVVHYTRGVRALVQAKAPPGGGPKPLTALDGMEALARLLACTAEPQAERARRMAPSVAGDPVALLAAARALRFYLPVEPGGLYEVEATIVPDEGELAVVQVEARRENGERAARGELRYLLVPGAGEHVRDSKDRDAVRARLGPGPW